MGHICRILVVAISWLGGFLHTELEHKTKVAYEARRESAETSSLE